MEILIFAAKLLLLFIFIAGLTLVIAFLASKSAFKTELEVEALHKKYLDLAKLLRLHTLDHKGRKSLLKELKRDKKKTPPEDQKKIYVLDFKGDIKANAVENLREEVSALLQVATPKDEVVLRLESPGGVVHGYGLAAAQLIRLKDHSIPLTICVDKVAASGGYMMACVANKIISAPFAIIGSIGVVAQVPNFHRVLKKNDVDYKEYTAGDFKRTVSILGEITAKGEEKFREQLEDTHLLFKSFVSEYRPQLEISQVATGEYWFGKRALDLKLVDQLMTSDDYLVSQIEKSQIFRVAYKHKEKWSEKVSGMISKAVSQTLNQSLSELETKRLL